MDARRLGLIRLAERASCAFGVIGLLGCGTFQALAATSTQHNLERFAALQVAAAGTPARTTSSSERAAGWRAALLGPDPAPIAVLRIERIRLAVPVLAGSGDRTLDRAIGNIEGTALPGTPGNVGLAGHRDTFFRGLRNIRLGDLIEVDTLLENYSYRVERIWVVDPTDVSVLAPTSGPVLTLVTCFPFDFIGSAPRRFIVRAVPANGVHRR
jgi:sortase A